MPQLITPKAKVVVVPKDGGIEITLNINITLDGKAVISPEAGAAPEPEKEEEPYMVPEFTSRKISFGKVETGS